MSEGISKKAGTTEGSYIGVPPSLAYRPEVDGLRALAVLPVILFHAGFPAFGGGFVGVDVFFVISGYLITSIILAEMRAGHFTILGFYERRARRILPALFFVMFACLPFAWLLLLPHDMRRFSESLAAVSVFGSNILFWSTSGYFEAESELQPLLHTWSLAVEEQFYLFFPLLLLLTWRLGPRWILLFLAIIAVASLTAAHWALSAAPAAAFYLLPMRAWELLIGSFIASQLSVGAAWKPTRIIREFGGLAGLLMLTLAVFTFDSNTRFPGTNALVPTLGAALIIVFATPQTLAGKLLGQRLLIGTGLLSYSAYLWHQPLLAFARHKNRMSLAHQ